MRNSQGTEITAWYVEYILTVNPVLQGKCHIGARNFNRGVIVSTTSEYYKRYPVSGRMLFQMDSMEVTGKLVDISRGGALIRSKVQPFEGEELTALLEVQDYPRVLEIRGMAMRVQSYSWSMMFLEEPAGLAELLQWLERTHGPVKVE